MNTFVRKNAISTLAVLSLSVAVVACGGSSSGDSTNVTEAGSVIIDNDFQFPTVNNSAQGVSVDIPDGAVPAFSARRTITAGSGNAIEFGDPVVLKYDMFSWTTGEKVESSEDFDEAFTVLAGVADGGVPEYLAKSLLGRKIGDTMEIVFEAGMEDLPEYLDNSDAYVLVIELI